MNLWDFPVYLLQHKLQSGEISSVEIVRAFRERISQVEGKVKAFITLDEEGALREAARVDQEGGYTGLAGIPYGLKDLICTRGMKTTCASRMLEDFIPVYDAFVVAKLRETRALLMGKTNLDEFAMGSSTEQSAFFPTRNPWALDRVPGGSSGGSAAAVSAREVPFCLGTDTGGSIRQPAAYCGVVGLKPTYGRVSRRGVVPYASSLDQVGVLAQNVRDCALVFSIIAGHDPGDTTCVNVPVPDFVSALDEGVKGIKIAYPREYFALGVDEEIKAAVMKSLKKLEELGAIVEEVSLPHSEYALPAYYLLAPAEASANLARFDGVRYGYRDLEADNVIDMFAQTRGTAFGAEVKRRIMLGTYALSSGYYDAYYLKALKVRRLISSDFDKVFASYDLIVTPTTPTPPFIIGAHVEDPITLYMNDILTVPVNMAGLPAMSIPCGLTRGLPLGMQIIAKPFAESLIMQAAYAFEQNTEYHSMKPELEV